jgi:hypothetical protein
MSLLILHVKEFALILSRNTTRRTKRWSGGLANPFRATLEGARVGDARAGASLSWMAGDLPRF